MLRPAGRSCWPSVRYASHRVCFYMESQSTALAYQNLAPLGKGCSSWRIQGGDCHQCLQEVAGCSQAAFSALQALHQASQPELPWLASAMLHAMTAMPAEPAALPGAQPRPAAQAAGALLGACCTCTEPAALCAMREALQSALQHQPHAAGRPLFNVTVWHQFACTIAAIALQKLWLPVLF